VDGIVEPSGDAVHAPGMKSEKMRVRMGVDEGEMREQRGERMCTHTLMHSYTVPAVTSSLLYSYTVPAARIFSAILIHCTCSPHLIHDTLYSYTVPAVHIFSALVWINASSDFTISSPTASLAAPVVESSA
jgi:hypothetical protein